MKTTPHTETSVAEEATTTPSPVRVCMHLLVTARTDYRVMRDATALVEAGFSVSIVDVESERARPPEEDIDGVHMKHIFMPSWFISTRFKPWFLAKLALMIICGTVQLLRTQADIYHAHVERALPACYIVARLFRKPLIYDAPELPLADPSITRWRRLSALATRFLAYMIPRCTGIITASPLYAHELHNRYHVPEVTVIRNVPVYRIVPKSDRLRQHLSLSPVVRLALYQGNLQPNRGLDRLIQAAQFLASDIVIVLMGKGMGTTQAQLEALIAREGVAERVKMLPPVPYEELLDWTASADLGLNILPPEYSLSIRWCLPNKVFEYLMAGLPVLTSELEAVVEVIKTYDVGQVVSSLVPADVGAAINSMLADRLALASMRRNALNAAQELCWEKERQQLFRLYYDILGV